MPRSLHACYDEIMPIIEQVSGTRQNEARRLSGELHAKLHFSRMADILKDGLYEFLEDFISANAEVGNEIHRSFISANS